MIKLKLYIKPLLAAFLLMMMFGSIFLVFSQKPEMVSFDDRKVAEPELPAFDANLNLNTTENMSTDATPRSLVADAFKADKVEEPKVAALNNETPDIAEPEDDSADVVVNVAEYKDDSGDVVALDVPVTQAEEIVELNIPTPEPVRANLIDGEDIVLDEINKRLQIISEAITSELGMDSKEEETQAAKKDVDVEPESKTEMQVEEASVAESDDESVEITRTTTDRTASVLSMPEIDWDMFDGNSPESLEYRASVVKLRAVIAETTELDKENTSLRKRFESLSDKNQELAAMIEDIDVKIKSFEKED